MHGKPGALLGVSSSLFIAWYINLKLIPKHLKVNHSCQQADMQAFLSLTWSREERTQCAAVTQPNVAVAAAVSPSTSSSSPPAQNPIHSSFAYKGLFSRRGFERAYCFYLSWICYRQSDQCILTSELHLHCRAWPTGTAGLQATLHNLCSTDLQKSQWLYRQSTRHTLTSCYQCLVVC